ncbi:hypothetical protein KKA33_04405 [Patescibacteria group bacterium]|nr:hypothetical protein [Patescibacteria group bacterium]
MKKAFSPQSHYYVFALLFAIMAIMGGVFYDDIQNIGLRADDWDVPTATTISNVSPVFTTTPADDSDSSSPTNIGSDVTFTGAATDLNGDQYYLAICKTDAVSVGDNAAPTCTGGEWDISAVTNSGSAPTVSPTYTVTSSETNETYDWFAFVCDKKVSADNPACYPGNDSGDQGSALGTVTLSDIPVDEATVTIDSVAYEFDDNSSYTGTQVDVSASQTPAEAAEELVTVEAGSSSSMVRRGNIIYVYADTEGVGGNSIAMSKSGDTGDDIALSGSTLSGGSDTGKSPFNVNHGPTFGSVTVTDATELLTNGTMETGDPPSNWPITADATVTSVADERDGGSGSSSMEATKDVNTWVARQDITTVIGDTYRGSAWLKNIDATYARVLISNSNNSVVYSDTPITATVWTYTSFTFVAEDTTTRVWYTISGDSGGTARLDDISVVGASIEPGDNLRFILPQAEIADSDTEGGQDTLNMHICTDATTSFNYSTNACTGGSLICSVTSVDPTSQDAACDESGNALAPVPTAHGSYNFKVYVEDSHDMAGTGTNQQSYSVEDVLPVLVSYSTIDTLSIAAGGSDTLTYSVSLTDDNGDNDVTDLSMTFFDSNEVNSDCDTDENDCYSENIAGNCAWTNKGSGTDNALGADCDYTIYFNANAGTNWEVAATVVDGNGSTDLGASTAQDFEIASLQGIDVVQTTIAYSTVEIGGTSDPIETSMGNVGNTDIDILIHGADMTCQTSATCGSNTIGQEQQRWHSGSNSFDWDDSETGDGPYILDETSGTGGGGAGCIDHDLRKRDSYSSTSINQSVYWKLRILSSQSSGNYQGSNTFTSTAGCDAETCNNSTDDDGDGRTDCADHHDCDLSALCTELDLPMGTAQHDSGNNRTLDTSPNGNHAIFGDGATSTTYPTKLSPMVGYELDGGDYFDAGDVFTTNQTEFTASAWVYVDAFNTHISTNIRTPFISDWNTWDVGGQEGFNLNAYYSQATDTMGWQFNIADGTDYYTTGTTATDATTFNSTYAGRWIHVIGTYKAGEYMRIYLDGVQMTNKTTGLPAQMDPDTASTTWIGRTGVNPGYLDGKIAEIKIFDYVFDDTQAENLYLEHMSRFK